MLAAKFCAHAIISVPACLMVFIVTELILLLHICQGYYDTFILSVYVSGLWLLSSTDTVQTLKLSEYLLSCFMSIHMAAVLFTTHSHIYFPLMTLWENKCVSYR